MKILITGSSGFVGSNLVPYLSAKGFQVEPLSLRGKWPFKPFAGDAIIHLAGKAHDLKGKSADEEYFRVNTDLTKALFDQFLDSDLPTFIFFSTVAAVNEESIEGELREDFPPSPQTPYGKSKLAAEEYIKSHSLPEGKRVIILRPAMIHGRGDKGNLTLLHKFVSLGVPYPLGAYENKRSFLSIDNLCFVVEKILGAELASGVYNLVDDEAISTKELVLLIGELKNKKPILLKVPKIIIEGLASFGNIIKLPLNTRRLKKLTENYVVDNSKLKRALSLQSMPVSARDGLTYTIKSFK